MLKIPRYLLWPALALLLANGIILLGAPPLLRYSAALALLAFLPGWAWIEVFDRPAVLHPVERIVLAVGLSLAATVFGLMAVVYLPGALSVGQVLVVMSGLTVSGLLVATLRKSGQTGDAPAQAWGIILLVALLLLALAALLRLPRLGYAEFHEDEAEALMLGVRLLRGEDYALLLHRKGPAQMLVPVAFWLLSGQLTEALARGPFALSSLLSVVTIFLLGRRWFNWPTGAVAALLWAANGYAIAFGRMVQYQALIFFWGPLALLTLTIAWRERRPGLQLLAAVLLAASLLAHFDALLLLPAAAYLGWLLVTQEADQTGGSTPAIKIIGAGARPALKPGDHKGRPYAKTLFSGRASRRSRILALLSLVLFVALLATFFVPYFQDPEFQNTANYLSQSRVKPGLLYNNLPLLRRFDRDYSSQFYLPLLAAGVAGAALLLARRRWQLVGLGAGLLLALSTFFWADSWRFGALNLAVVPWLLLGGALFFMATTPVHRAAWLLLGAPFIGYVFLVSDPRTHLYIMYPGAMLLAGVGWAGLWPWRRLRWLAAGVGALLLGAVMVYETLIFLPTESAFTRLRQQWDGSVWAQLYQNIPQPREYFGYPKHEGWKTVGVLRADGQFPGDFRSVNEDFVIPIWYNFGQARSCYDTPAQLFVRVTGPDAIDLPAGYQLAGQVEREGEPRLVLASAEAAPLAAPPTFKAEEFSARFDQLATPNQFTRQNQPTHPVGTQFGPAIEFEGFDLFPAAVAPGQTLHINLYWRALAAPDQNYRAFVHLTNGSTLWAQQDDTPACRLPTTIWRAGQHAAGQFRLDIAPNTPPGRYPLIIGLYRADTMERLKITAGAGQPGDDFLWLNDVEVTPGG